MSFPNGQAVLPQAYTTEEFQIVPWVAGVSNLAVGKRYTVKETQTVPYEGVDYVFCVIERQNPNDPGPLLQWPESKLKLAFGGGIS